VCHLDGLKWGVHEKPETGNSSHPPDRDDCFDRWWWVILGSSAWWYSNAIPLVSTTPWSQLLKEGVDFPDYYRTAVWLAKKER
jgi:hypothetical protein